VSDRTSNERVPLTTVGRRQIEDEATRLQGRLSELRDLLEDAHADRTADDDERAAALGLLDEHQRLESRLTELRAILESALDARPVSTDVAGLGTTVLVREGDGTEEAYTLVSPAEAAPADGRISVNSPLGQALAGKKPGEKATVAAPSGSWEIEVVKIEAAA
jgi:transcription elongation factor GreA